MLWDSVLWDSVLWDFVRRDFVLWDFVLWDSVPDSNGGAEKGEDKIKKNCLVKVEGRYWGEVRQEHTNKFEKQSVQDGCKTGHDVWCRTLGS